MGGDTRKYRLHGHVIFESAQGDGWVEWVEENGTLFSLVGDIKIDRSIDVLVLYPARDRCGEPKLKTIKEVQRFIGSLSPWRSTRYYSKMSAMGSGGLRECRSGDLVDPEFEYEQHPQVVLRYNNLERTVDCATCGRQTTSRVPLAIFLFDQFSPFPFRSVCDVCGSRYAPMLARILEEYYGDSCAANGFSIKE